MKYLATLMVISATLCAAPAWAQSASGPAAEQPAAAPASPESQAHHDAIVKMRQEIAAARRTYNQKVAEARKIFNDARAAAGKERDDAIAAARAAASGTTRSVPAGK